MRALRGAQVRLRPARDDDATVISEIRRTPEVYRHWGGDDIEAEFLSDLHSTDINFYIIEDPLENVVGALLWQAEANPDYRKAALDIYLHPSVHGKGFATDAIRTLATHLFHEEGHHRLTIDPAADNEEAIRCYSRVGFERIGIMRKYERGPDGEWHDGILMDLLAEDFVPDPQPAAPASR